MKSNNNKRNTVKKPWPTQAAMQQVYEKKLWGKGPSGFYSGEGSHTPSIVQPYLKAVKTFLNSFQPRLVVCDLGCGDFQVGKELIPLSRKLVAVDIVPELIAYNKNVFKHDHLTFLHLDIAKDPLPEGDCALIRQVLQHLSNAEIKAVLEKLCKYKYVILTEHIPDGDFKPNIDIISGQGTRLKKRSGVDVLAAPFNLKVKKSKLLVKVNLESMKGSIVTTLYTMH